MLDEKLNTTKHCGCFLRSDDGRTRGMPARYGLCVCVEQANGTAAPRNSNDARTSPVSGAKALLRVSDPQELDAFHSLFLVFFCFSHSFSDFFPPCTKLL